MQGRFTQSAIKVLKLAQYEAKHLKHRHVGTEHILLGLLHEGTNVAAKALSSIGIDLYTVRQRVHELVEKEDFDDLETEEIGYSPEAKTIMEYAVEQAQALGHDYIGTEHILLGIIYDTESIACEILISLGADLDIIHDAILDLLNEDTLNDMPKLNVFKENKAPKKDNNTKDNKQKNNSATPLLDKYGRDLNILAQEEKIDPVIGRNREIERVIQILSRRTKNNPILIGEPGVGKSAIVEGLALRIVEKKVSRILFDKRVIALDMTAVVAGTKYRGQFEERIRSILNELKKNPNIILFIDEIHTIVGAGSAAGSMDAANMLKPALARGEIQCIGATTLDEYRQNIEKDGALERRFQKVIVEPTTPEETIQILQNIKEKYEDHHNVNYTDAALEACVKLTERYITDRNFPDKAIDALDEAGSRVHLINISAPKEIEEQEKLIDEMKSLKNEAVKLQNFELAASYRDKEKEYAAQLDILKEKWEKALKENRETVDEEQIADVVSMISGIPVQKMAQTEGVKLLSMKDELLTKVVGQDKAINTLVKAIQRSRVGLKDPNKPIGTFMFLGPTGVGKTHLAKELSKLMFGSTDALIRIDMSEYMEKFTVSRLVGAPPGYVGYEEGGQLTEKVRRKPYSIVLLDEIEKAHPDVFNILLQVMDEGRLTDSYGRTVDFKNTVVIMTSNIGTRQLKEFGKGIGFTTQAREDDKEYAKGVITKALNKAFAPEFINRLDEIINFDQLDMEALVKIIDIELKGLYQRIENIGYKMIIDDEAKRFVASKGYDIQFGARPLKRAIQNYLEDGLSEIILGTELQPGDTIKVSYNKEEDAISMTVEK